ncbi:ribosome-inactivating protein [Hypomontagnella monticulosa]|nr:ribosome-inactivating protein [Hypomontagnella monticulosa]
MSDNPPTLNVDNHKEEYQSFITGLRTTFGNPGTFVRNRPVLPRQSTTPTSWIDIVLRTGNTRLRLRLRRDNLYLDAFRNDAAGSTWYEIGNDRSTHLIAGSTFTGFDGSYAALERAAGIGDQTRLATVLGQTQLQNSIRQLAALTNPSANRRDTASSLLVVVQMICESTRLQWISDYLTENWTNSQPTPRTMLDYETSWGTLSEALHAEQDPDPAHFRLPTNQLGITNAAGVAAALGILLYRALPGSSSRQARDLAVAAVPWGDYPKGRPMLEIYWIRVEKIDGEDPGECYGTVWAYDSIDTRDIFNVIRDYAQSVEPGARINLTGPKGRCMLASDEWSLQLDLWDRDYDASPDDKIGQEKITWSPYALDNTYDKAIGRRVDGEYGWVTVNYEVLSNAAQAFIEIIVVNGDDEDPSDIYGTLKTDNGHGTCYLFDLPKAERRQVGQGAAIPLDRNAVAVPMGGSLKISAELWDWDSLSDDDEVAKGEVKFDVDLLKSASKTIKGDSGEISVRVTWS